MSREQYKTGIEFNKPLKNEHLKFPIKGSADIPIRLDEGEIIRNIERFQEQEERKLRRRYGKGSAPDPNLLVGPYSE